MKEETIKRNWERDRRTDIPETTEIPEDDHVDFAIHQTGAPYMNALH